MPNSEVRTEILIAPSILSADFGRLNEDVADIEGKGADVLHVDTMDGHFVPNLSFGALVLKWIKTDMPKHCHLMVSNPAERIEEFVDAGADTIIFHTEALDNDTVQMKALLDVIKGHGVKAGVSIKPGTSIDVLDALLDEVDEVLVMSVEPGFGGQSFMPVALEKIAALRAARPVPFDIC